VSGAGRDIRNWQPIAAIMLNPERDSLVNAAVKYRKESPGGCMEHATI
jgi:hypothetical protein